MEGRERRNEELDKRLEEKQREIDEAEKKLEERLKKLEEVDRKLEEKNKKLDETQVKLPIASSSNPANTQCRLNTQYERQLSESQGEWSLAYYFNEYETGVMSLEDFVNTFYQKLNISEQTSSVAEIRALVPSQDLDKFDELIKCRQMQALQPLASGTTPVNAEKQLRIHDRKPLNEYQGDWTLAYYYSEYETGAMSLEAFVAAFAEKLETSEKSSSISEIRALVPSEDLTKFDELIEWSKSQSMQVSRCSNTVNPSGSGETNYTRGLSNIMTYSGILNEHPNSGVPGASEIPENYLHYMAWRDQRKTTIAAVENLVTILDRVNVGSQVVKGVEYLSVITGGLSTIAGIILAARGAPAATSFINFGSSANAVGRITFPISVIVDKASTHIVNKIEESLEKDQQLSLQYARWFHYSREMNNQLQEAFGTDIRSNAFSDVVSIFRECGRLYQVGHEQFEQVKERLVYMLNQRRVTPEDIARIERCLIKFWSEFQNSTDAIQSKLSELMDNVYERLLNSARILQSCKNSLDLYASVFGTENIPEILSFLTVQNYCPADSYGSGVCCSFQAINTLANVFLLADLIMKRGETEYSKYLKATIEQLKLELTLMEMIQGN